MVLVGVRVVEESLGRELVKETIMEGKISLIRILKSVRVHFAYGRIALMLELQG